MGVSWPAVSGSISGGDGESMDESLTRQACATRERSFELFAEHVSRGKVAAFESFGFDPVMGRREGAWFFDAYDDRSWYNCHCNGGLFNLGHRHPRLLAALRRALEELDIGNHHLVSGIRAELGRRLASSTGDVLPRVVYGVGGGEAMDLALKVARGVTGRMSIVSAAGGYHGHTGLAMATGDAYYRDPFGPNLPGFVQVPFDDVEALESAIGPDVAALVLEPIPATLGMPIASPGYLEQAQRICRRHGALFIVDEVQTGFGRCGATWAFLLDDLQPDMLVCGKAMSGGLYPIAATLMTKEVHSIFDEHPFVHISTFGGSEIGCVVALEVMNIVEEPGFLERVHELGEHFERGLAGLPFRVRRRGMMMGLEFPAKDAGMMASQMLYGAGVFAVWANNDTSVLQFLPPLTTSDEEADDIISRVRSTFG